MLPQCGQASILPMQPCDNGGFSSPLQFLFLSDSRYQSCDYASKIQCGSLIKSWAPTIRPHKTLCLSTHEIGRVWLTICHGFLWVCEASNQINQYTILGKSNTAIMEMCHFICACECFLFVPTVQSHPTAVLESHRGVSRLCSRCNPSVFARRLPQVSVNLEMSNTCLLMVLVMYFDHIWPLLNQ